MVLGQTQLCFAFVNKVLLAQCQSQCFIVVAAVMLQRPSVLTGNLDSLRLVVSLVAGFKAPTWLLAWHLSHLFLPSCSFSCHICHLSFVSWCPLQLFSFWHSSESTHSPQQTTLAVLGSYSNFVCQNISLWPWNHRAHVLYCPWLFTENKYGLETHLPVCEQTK